MPAPVGTELLLVFSEPLLVLRRVSAMSAVLAPNHHAFAETAFADDAQLVAIAVTLRDGFLAPPAGNVVAGVALGDVREHLILGHHDGVGCDLVHLEVVEELDIGQEDLVHEVFGDEGGAFVHEADGGDHCRLQLVLIHQLLQDID